MQALEPANFMYHYILLHGGNGQVGLHSNMPRRAWIYYHEELGHTSQPSGDQGCDQESAAGVCE